MLVIEELRRLPPLARIGLAVMVSGALLDIAINLTGSPHAMHHAMGPNHLGHLVALAGMVLVLAAVVISAVRRQRSRGASAADNSGGLETNAHR
jgi:hypothetical protein